ncbi:hypothetical protein P691DRAFT_765867 [Macrolepiota fuliginosa MF-IS2]|uniref:Uncharacterized protein n=1 Tax=Macrolepiota fuliginosa MF-IS2 TaxID=1400762 RepID=A0A9P6BXK8_9AGAR|nr:hypothetical protein P691DRAFT_765867 [Macrolepiota fuliginosa MF-IS2]
MPPKKKNATEAAKLKGSKKVQSQWHSPLAVGEEVKDEAIEIDWTKDLTWKLINCIQDDVTIKEELFPLPGSNKSVSKGGSKTKTDYHNDLALLVFENDPTYGPLIEGQVCKLNRSLNRKKRMLWSQKIKNHLTQVVEAVKKARNQMGQTGEGIEQAEDVNMSLKNQLTNCWTEIWDDMPWFWEVKSLIAKHPNMVPVGLGNSMTRYNISVLGTIENTTKPSSDAPKDQDASDFMFSEGLESEAGKKGELDGDGSKHKGCDATGGEQTDEGSEVQVKGQKHKEREEAEVKTHIRGTKKKPTGPQPAKLAPAQVTSQATHHMKKAKTGIEQLSAIAEKDTETVQHVIELQKEKSKGHTE